MIQLLTIGLGVIGSILVIIRWLGSYKRKREGRMQEILKLIAHGEKVLAEALARNDSDSISRFSEQLRKLRLEYKHLLNK